MKQQDVPIWIYSTHQCAEFHFNENDIAKINAEELIIDAHPALGGGGGEVFEILEIAANFVTVLGGVGAASIFLYDKIRKICELVKEKRDNAQKNHGIILSEGEIILRANLGSTWIETIVSLDDKTDLDKRLERATQLIVTFIDSEEKIMSDS